MNFRVLFSMNILVVLALGASAGEPGAATEVLARAKSQVSGIAAWNAQVQLTRPARNKDFRPETLYRVQTRDGQARIEVLTENDEDIHLRPPESSYFVSIDESGLLASAVYFENPMDAKGQVVHPALKMTLAGKSHDHMVSLSPGCGTPAYPHRYLQLLCRSPRSFYEDIAAGFDFALLEDAGAVTDVYRLTGVLKEELREKYSADKHMREMFEPIGSIMLELDSHTGMPLHIVTTDLDGGSSSALILSKLEISDGEASLDIAWDFGQAHSISLDESAEQMDMILAGTWDAHWEEMLAAADTRNVPKNVQVGEMVPALTGPGLVGEMIDLATFRGKVVFVDFWATWCGPCVAEMPNVLENYRKYREQGFEVLGVSFDEEADAVEAFLDEHPEYTWLQICEETGKGDSPLADQFGIGPIPSSVLVGRDGTILGLNLRSKRLDAALAEIFENGTD